MSDLKERFRRSKRVISGAYFTAALLMLSLFFVRERWWQVGVFAGCAVLALLIFRAYRCPGCGKRLRSDFDGTCPECGQRLEDPE